MAPDEPSRDRHGQPPDSRGLLIAVAAYLLWGAFPLYFALLEAAQPLEIVAHRVAWTFVFCLAGIAALRTWDAVRGVLRNRRLLAALVVAGALVAVNWLIYVWAVLNDHVVDAALGYFVNPLATVTLAVLVLHERLRPAQKIALVVGAAAVVVIAVGNAQLPWVALLLALTFSLYSLAKNRVGAHVGPLVGLATETALLAPISAGYLMWLQVVGAGTFTGHGGTHTALLVATGAVTAVPLLLFAAAAGRIPLSMLGLIQYLTPVIQFSIGVWINHEVMPPARWAGFALVWVALVVLTVDSLRAARPASALVEPEPVG